MIGHDMHSAQVDIILACDFHNWYAKIDIYWNFNSLASSGTNNKRALYCFGIMAQDGEINFLLFLTAEDEISLI